MGFFLVSRLRFLRLCRGGFNTFSSSAGANKCWATMGTVELVVVVVVSLVVLVTLATAADIGGGAATAAAADSSACVAGPALVVVVSMAASAVADDDNSIKVRSAITREGWTDEAADMEDSIWLDPIARPALRISPLLVAGSVRPTPGPCNREADPKVGPWSFLVKLEPIVVIDVPNWVSLASTGGAGGWGCVLAAAAAAIMARCCCCCLRRAAA